MKKIKGQIICGGVALILLGLLWFLKPVAIQSTSVYTVQPGDTMWTIAEQLIRDGDTRYICQIVYDIQEDNRLATCDLAINQKLILNKR